MRMFIIFIATVFVIIGCQSKEDKALLEKIKAREAAKIRLVQNPTSYIVPGQWDKFDKGIINSYTKAVAMNFTNNSEFDVDEITGSMSYVGKDGNIIATVPFIAAGTLRSGQTLKLSVKAGEVSGSAKQAKITVERVHIIGQ